MNIKKQQIIIVAILIFVSCIFLFKDKKDNNNTIENDSVVENKEDLVDNSESEKSLNMNTVSSFFESKDDTKADDNLSFINDNLDGHFDYYKNSKKNNFIVIMNDEYGNKKILLVQIGEEDKISKIEFFDGLQFQTP